MANKVTIDVEARFVDNVSGEAKDASKSFKDVEKSAKSAAKAVDSLGKKDAKPKLDANTDKFKRAIDNSDKKLAKFGRTKAEAKLGAEDKATSKIDKALNKVKNFASKTYSAILTAKDAATAGITKALNAAKRFAGKTYSAMVKIRDSEALSSLRKITSGVEKIAGKTWSAVIKIKDAFTSPLRALKNSLFSIRTLMGGIATAWATQKLVLNPINVADQYSSAKIGFSTLMGAEAGQQMMDDLDAFAKKTPFNTTNVISSAQKMMAMGWDPEDIIGDLETLGNAAAATGNLNQGLESIVRAMSQIKTKGRLSTEELNQLAEAGIAAKAMLAEQLGYGTGDAGIAAMTKDLEDGAIASDQAIQALMAGMKKYDGMMDSMANETVEGLSAQIEDAFNINVVRKWGQGLQDGAKRGFGSIVSLLDEAETALSEFGDTLYEVGKTISNWAADKLENAIKRLTDITGSDAFKNADLGEKISMLWKGVISDPLKEWWEGGGKKKTAETAEKIGSWMGKTITSGLLSIFGATDILDDETAKQLGESGGMSIAQSFAKGFKDNFDGSAITEALVNAIGDVWKALPTWSKVLLGGYAAGKAIGGFGNLVGGAANLVGNVGNIIGGNVFNAAGGVIGATGLIGLLGSTGNAMVSGTGILGKLAGAGYALTGGPASAGAYFGAGMSGAAAAGIGALGVAGGLAAGASAIKGGLDLYKAYKTEDEVEAKARKASGWTSIGGVGAGAGIGFAVGGPLGALVGAGIGGIAGWIGGNKWADSIREGAASAKFAKEELVESAVAVEKGEKSAEELRQEIEQFKLEKARECFGDMELSMEEIARLSQQVVFGDDLPKYQKFIAATQQAEASLQALNTAGAATDRWMWKASLGVIFNEDEVAAIQASFDEYINAAKQYVEDKHYEFTASAELLLDLESKEGKAIIKDGNAYYAQIEKELNTAGKELGNLLTKSLADGFISADESEAIAAAQQKIADITKKIADAEADAELTIIDLKFGSGKLSKESFDAFMASTESNLNDRLSSADAAVKAQISNLNLQFPEDQRNSDAYKQKLQAIIDGYNVEVESITASILGLELEIIGESFSGADMLGDDAVDDLNKMIQQCVDEGITPAEMPLDEIIKLSGNPKLGDENAELIQDYLQGVFDQLDLSKFELIEVDGKMQLKLKTEVEGGAAEEVGQAIESQIPDSFYETVDLHVTPVEIIEAMKRVMPADFDVPQTIDSTVILKLNAAATVQEKVEILASEFGINEEESASILWNISAYKSIRNRISITAGDFGIPKSVSTTVDVFVVGNKIISPKYRGGIVGGSSAMGSFARGGIAGDNIPGFSDGGMVRGGSQLIEVAEEGSPEMIIPLSSQRRGRALKLWAQAGHMMGVPGFARGGIIGGDGSKDEGIRFHTIGGDSSAGGQSIQVDIGGITVEINVNAENTSNIAEAIKAQANEIADAVAGIMADAIGGQFENMPVRGGVA